MTTTAHTDDNLTLLTFPIDNYPHTGDEDWLHPLLEIFKPRQTPVNTSPAKLYLIPTHYEGEFDLDFAPEPTSAADLPGLLDWVGRLAHNVVEIWAGRRSPNQVAQLCHYTVFSELVRKSGSEKLIGHIRKIHIQEPLDGICEATITVRYENRLRSVVLRLEGLDNRWLCTVLTLL